EEFDPPTWHAQLIQSSGEARHAGESYAPKSGLPPPQFGRVGPRTGGGGGLLHVGPHSQPLAPSPGGAFLFGTSPRVRRCPDAELSEIISALYPSKLGPVAAGPFFFRALFFRPTSAPPPPACPFPWPPPSPLPP